MSDSESTVPARVDVDIEGEVVETCTTWSTRDAADSGSAVVSSCCSLSPLLTSGFLYPSSS